jgi:hypothetical protein
VNSSIFGAPRARNGPVLQGAAEPGVPKEVIFGTVNRVSRGCSKNPKIQKLVREVARVIRRGTLGKDRSAGAYFGRPPGLLNSPD